MHSITTTQMRHTSYYTATQAQKHKYHLIQQIHIHLKETLDAHFCLTYVKSDKKIKGTKTNPNLATSISSDQNNYI